MFSGQYFVEPDAFGGIPDILSEWQQSWPEMGLLVLLPEAEKHQVPALQAICKTCKIPLLGAIFPSLVTALGLHHQGAWLLRFNQMPKHFLVEIDPETGANGGSGLYAATGRLLATGCAEVATPSPTTPKTAPTLFLIFDGMLPNIASVLYRLSANHEQGVTYCGVNAGSESFQPMACLFDGERQMGNAVLGLLIDHRVKTVVKHGYPVSKSLMQATSTTGNRIDRINQRPAFEVYQEVIKQEYGIELTHQNFYEYAVHFPFGVVMTVDVLVRIPVAFNEDGSLVCVGEVQPNAMLRLLRAPTLEQSGCVQEVAASLKYAPVREEGCVTTLFYCAGRRMHFGERAIEEIAALSSATDSQSLVGALTLGEIDTDEDLMHLARFHNAAMVCIR